MSHNISLFLGSINSSVQFEKNLHIHERTFSVNATSTVTKGVILTDFNGSIGFEFDGSECTECLESYETKFKAD